MATKGGVFLYHSITFKQRGGIMPEELGLKSGKVGRKIKIRLDESHAKEMFEIAEDMNLLMTEFDFDEEMEKLEDLNKTEVRG